MEKATWETRFHHLLCSFLSRTTPNSLCATWKPFGMLFRHCLWMRHSWTGIKAQRWKPSKLLAVWKLNAGCFLKGLFSICRPEVHVWMAEVSTTWTENEAFSFSFFPNLGARQPTNLPWVAVVESHLCVCWNTPCVWFIPVLCSLLNNEQWPGYESEEALCCSQQPQTHDLIL